MKGRAIRVAGRSSIPKALLICRFAMLSALLLVLSQIRLSAQSDSEFYEISVNLDIKRVGCNGSGCSNKWQADLPVGKPALRFPED